MNQFMNWFINGARFLLAEFFGQIIAGVILFAAFVAWVYFSSIYAAIPVLIVGILLWGIVGKVFERKKSENTKKNQE